MPNDVPDWSQLVSITSGPLQVSDITATGLAGAAATSHWIGAVNGADPTGGPHAQGDWVIDFGSGGIRVCTAGGTPGTWSRVTAASIGGAATLVLAAILSLGGDLNMTEANPVMRMNGAGEAALIGGTTGWALWNQAFGARNIQSSDAGLVTLRNALQLPPSAGGTLAPTSYGHVPIKFFESIGAVASPIRIPASGSLPTTFRKIRVGFRVRGTGASVTENFNVNFNDDSTGGNYESELIAAVAGNITAQASGQAIATIPAANAAAGLMASGWLEVVDYNNATVRKGWDSQLGLNDSGSRRIWTSNGEYLGSTGAVTSLSFTCTGFAAGTALVVELYP